MGKGKWIIGRRNINYSTYLASAPPPRLLIMIMDFIILYLFLVFSKLIRPLAFPPQKPGNMLARDLPYSHHSQSFLICRHTGEVMDENNPPMALPNGQVIFVLGLVLGVIVLVVLVLAIALLVEYRLIRYTKYDVITTF